MSLANSLLSDCMWSAHVMQMVLGLTSRGPFCLQTIQRAVASLSRLFNRPGMVCTSCMCCLDGLILLLQRKRSKIYFLGCTLICDVERVCIVTAGFQRTVTVALDAAQYQLDMEYMQEHKSEDVYSTFNLLMRRKPKVVSKTQPSAALCLCACSMVPS